MAAFSFLLLPWSFQKRFSEICDAQTMLAFKKVSSQTQQLSKNRIICKRIKITGYFDHDYEYFPNEKLKNVKIYDIQNVETIEMEIDLGKTKITKEFIQSFTFITPYLNVTSFNIEFDALKILLERHLTCFSFLGRIIFKNVDQELEYLINLLADVHAITFTLIFKHGDPEHLFESIEEYGKKKKCYKLFKYWNCTPSYFGISKNWF